MAVERVRAGRQAEFDRSVVACLHLLGRSDFVPNLPEVTPLTSPADQKDLAAEWLALGQRFEGSSYFQTPDWVLSWWESVAGRPPTEIAEWRGSSGALEAVVAVSRITFPLTRRAHMVADIWVNAGYGNGADHCGWPILPHRIEDVRRWLDRRTAGTTLILFGMDPDTGVSVVPPGARLLTRYTCPRRDLQAPHSADRYRVEHHRRLEQQRKKLLREGVTFQWIPPGHASDRILDVLFSLHELRFRAKGERSYFTRDRTDLHRRLIARSAARRGPCALLAEHQGQPIAIEYGFWWRDAYYSHQGGWDPSWAKSGVGKILLNEMMQTVRSEGGRIFDFSHGTEPIKYYFGGKDRWDESWIVPRGPTGRAFLLKSFIDAQLQHHWARPIAKVGELVRRRSGGENPAIPPDEARASSSR